MVEVWIRTEYEERGRFLFDWPSTKLEDVIPLLVLWGVETDDRDDAYGKNQFCAHFRIDGSKAYYEVICCD